MNHNKITVKVTVKASLEKAWTRWTAPEHIVNWNYASDDWHCPEAHNELRPGGRFRYVMASRDGQYSFDFEGTYSEVSLRKRISYKMDDGREVIILFESDHGQTTVIESFDPEKENTIELQRSGWQAILENFKRCAERN